LAGHRRTGVALTFVGREIGALTVDLLDLDANNGGVVFVDMLARS
jgi:hypothetical protein